MKIKESQIRNIVRNRISQIINETIERQRASIVNESKIDRIVNRVLNEAIDDLRVTVYETNDSYYDFTAKIDGGWSEIRGYYDGSDVYPEEMIIGNGGHGRQASDEEMESTFEEYHDAILSKVENSVNRGFVETYNDEF